MPDTDRTPDVSPAPLRRLGPGPSAPGPPAAHPQTGVPQEIGARTTWFKERGLNAPEAVEPEDETPPSNADAFAEAIFKKAEAALSATSQLPKDNVSGAATGVGTEDSGDGKDCRKKVTEGLKNIRDRVDALLGCAAERLGMTGDVEKGESAPPGLDEVVVVAAPRAPGARPENVPKRERLSYAQVVLGNDTAALEMKFEDGNAAFDAPVTPAENDDNQKRLLDFINNDVSVTNNDVISGQLPLAFEKKLVADNNKKLTPRMKTLAIKGSLSRLFEVAEGKLNVKVDDTDRADAMARAKDEIRVLIRSCTEETKGLPLPLCVLATPGSRVHSDGSSKTVFESPSLTSWPINGAVDNLAVKIDKSLARSALCTPVTFRSERGKAANRNAGTLLGGQGSSGGPGNKSPNSTNAERRWAVQGLKADTNVHQAIAASMHEDFVHGVSGPSALQMNEWKQRQKTPIQYEISIGKLRGLPPRSALIAAIRIFGDNGVITRGVPAGADEKRLWDQFLGDDEKKNITAAYLFLHALRFADYENILNDQSRRVLPILTDHSMREFYVHVFRGLQALMKDANSALPELFSVETIARTAGIVRRNATSAYEVPGAESSVKMLYRVITVLSPYDASQRGALTRVVGKEVTHGITVRRSLERTLASPRITGGYVADLKEFRGASVDACESLEHSAEHLLRLPVGAGKKRILEEKKTLRDRSDDGETTLLYKIMKTKAVNVDGKSFVHFVFLRVSQEETAESQTRLGFAVQLDMWNSQLRHDDTSFLNFPKTDAHHIVWIVSARSRLAADPLDQPVAIFEEKPNSRFRLPDLSTMKTATVGDAMKVALEAEDKNRGGRLVTMSAMYSDRVTLEEFMHAARSDVRVVGFDALDLRPLLDNFPEIALGNIGWTKRMIHVEEGYAGHAFVVHRLGAALAMPCDLNVLRHAGMEAANRACDVPDDAKTEKNKMAVAVSTTKHLNVFPAIVIPCWFTAAKRTLVVPTIGMYERKVNEKKEKEVESSLFVAALRHSGVEQLWRSQYQMLSWVVDLRPRPKVYLRPFPATQDLRKMNDRDDVPGFYVTNRWADDGSRPDPGQDGARRLKVKDIKSANFFASTSRAANPGVLEHARDGKRYLCLADVAIAVWKGELDDAWVRVDDATVGSSHPFARRLNLKNDYVYAILRALRDGGHLPHRYLLGQLVALGRAGAAFD